MFFLLPKRVDVNYYFCMIFIGSLFFLVCVVDTYRV